jgi:hypothetical protein
MNLVVPTPILFPSFDLLAKKIKAYNQHHIATTSNTPLH